MRQQERSAAVIPDSGVTHAINGAAHESSNSSMTPKWRAALIFTRISLVKVRVLRNLEVPLWLTTQTAEASSMDCQTLLIPLSGTALLIFSWQQTDPHRTSVAGSPRLLAWLYMIVARGVIRLGVNSTPLPRRGRGRIGPGRRATVRRFDCARPPVEVTGQGTH